MKNYHLFLDDMRMPNHVTWVKLPENVEWIIVKNYKQFVEVINKLGLPKYIAFDHDLGEEHYNNFVINEQGELSIDYSQFKEQTGYDCAKWLVEYCRNKDFDIPQYAVHSMSVIGKENIIQYLENYKLWKTQFKSS